MTPYSNVNRATNVSEICEQQPAAPDPFANLESLRLDQSYLETVGVRKLLKTVPVRKPGPQDFVRTHAQHRLTPAALIELKEDREIYFVAPSMGSELAGEFFVATLYLTITRQGVLSLWPVRLPSPDGKHLEWHRSAAEAAEAAQRRWVKIRANMNLGAYEIFEALSDNIPEPVWPDESFEQIIAQIAYITGHSLSDVRSILDANYLHRDPALGESAIAKLERAILPTGLPTEQRQYDHNEGKAREIN